MEAAISYEIVLNKKYFDFQTFSLENRRKSKKVVSSLDMYGRFYWE
jgi:hypothetical protein